MRYYQYKNIKQFQKFMENIGSQTPTDTASQTTLKAKKPTQLSQSIIYNIQSYPITISPWVSSIPFLLFFCYIINCIDAYSEKCNELMNYSNTVLLNQLISQELNYIAFIINSVLSFFCVLSLFYNKAKNQGVMLIIGWIGDKLFPLLRYLIEINLIVAALFMGKSYIVTPMFILASGINIFATFIAQNYTLRKDYLCCKSLSFLVLFKSTLIIGYLLNGIGQYIITSPILLITFTAIHLVLSMVLFISFFTFGFIIYRYKAPRIYLLTIINLYCSLSFANLYDLLTINKNVHTKNQNLIIGTFLFLFLNLLSYSLWTSFRRYIICSKKSSLKKKIYFLFNKLENSAEDISDDCETRGIIKQHLIADCQNMMCSLHTDCYDAKKNRVCLPQKINQCKGSFIKFIVKCLYENKISNNFQDVDLLLDFIEFYYTKLKNAFKVAILIAHLQQRFLTPFHKLRLVRIRNLIKVQNAKLNGQLFGGSFDFENLIFAESKFQEIKEKVGELLEHNINFWEEIQKNQINLNVLFNIFKPNLNTMEEINLNWKSISKYLEINPLWKHYLACYTFYLRNQSIQSKTLEQVNFQNAISFQSLDLNENFLNSGTNVYSKILFSDQICCINISHSQDNPLIKAVNRFFSKLFVYEKEQIHQSPISVLMTQTVKKIHQQKLLHWAGEGRSYNQNQYSLKKIFPINKNKFVVPVYKFYKQYQTDEQLRYVALMAKKENQEQIILLNINYEIEGITSEFIDKIGLTHHQYQQIIGLNILLILPELKQFTKFRDIPMKGMKIQRKNTRQLKVSDIDSKKTERQKEKLAKQFTKNNLSLVVPQNILFLSESYKKMRADSNFQDHFIPQIIEKIFQTVIINDDANIFKLDVDGKLIQLESEQAYIELNVRQLKRKGYDIDLLSKINYSPRQYKSLEDFDEPIQFQDELNDLDAVNQATMSQSIIHNSNIFIKEEHHSSITHNKSIKKVSIIMRMIYIFIGSFSLGNCILELNGYDGYEQYISEYEDTTQFQLNALQANNKMYSIILGVNISRKLEENIQKLQKIRNLLPFQTIILDYRSEVYYFKYEDTSRKYDQLDLIDMLLRNLVQIRYSKQLIQKNSHQVSNYEKLMIPAMQNMTKRCRQITNIKFSEIFEKLLQKNMILLVCGISYLAFGTFFILFYSSKVIKSLTSILEIFTNLSDKDINQIIKYTLRIRLLFIKLGNRYDQLSKIMPQKSSCDRLQNSSYINNGSANDKMSKIANIKQTNQMEAQNKQLSNLNKKVKTIKIGSTIKKIQTRLILLIFLFIVLFSISIFGVMFYVYSFQNSVEQIEKFGYNLLNYYPIFNILLIRFKEKAIYPHQFQMSRYQQYLERIELLKSLKKIQGTGFSQKYTNVYNSVFFGNFCQQYPEVLQQLSYTTQDCQVNANNNMQYGLQSFVYYLNSQTDLYLSQTSTAFDIDLANKLQIAVQISDLYLLYLLKIWHQEFTRYLHNSKNTLILIAGVASIYQILLFIFLGEIRTIRMLKRKYNQFRQIYEFMMPDFVIAKQKIIKAKLQVDGVIAT